MTTIGWDENLPSGSSEIRLGDDDIRSMTTNLRGALADEHQWATGPSSAERGKHTPNASRTSYGAVADAPATVDSGRSGLLYTETNAPFHMLAYVGIGVSQRSFIVGGRRAIQSAADPTVATAPEVTWVMSHQTGLSDSAIVYTQLYDGKPFVVASAETNIALFTICSSIDSREVTVNTYDTGGTSIPSIPVHVLSVGTATV